MKKGRHLSLVNGGRPIAPPAPRRLSTNAQGQFELELKDGEIRRITIIVMDAVHGTTLASAVDKLHPMTVIDLRQTLRFDQPGSSRAAFFEHLNRVRSMYLRAPIEWTREAAAHLTAGESLPVRVHHEAIERWEGHLALLVSKVEHGRYLAAILNRALSEHRSEGWEIEQVA